jgi:predicted transcriptional regulator
MIQQIDEDRQPDGVYRLSDSERAAVARGLADMREGRFASDEAVAAIFQRARRANDTPF